MRRLITVLFAVAPVAALLTGCGSHQDGGPARPAPTVSATSAAPGGSDGTGNAPSAPSPATTTAAGGTTAGGTTTGRCHTRDLKVFIAPEPGGGAAGTSYESLVFRNVSPRACTLYGYPGVSFVAGDRGTQVGDPFTRGEGTKTTIRLTPAGTAHATLGIVDARNFDPAVCKPETVRGLRVYPPDETAAVFVSRPQTACSAKGIGRGQVLPIAAGSSGAA